MLSFSAIPIFDFGNTGYRFRQYWFSILAKAVIEFGNTGEGKISKIWARLRAKSNILKTWGSWKSVKIWD